MKILGIDPSLKCTAQACIEWTGERYVYLWSEETVRRPKLPLSVCLSAICDDMSDPMPLIDAVAIEEPAGHSLKQGGMALGAVMAGLGCNRIEPALVAPSTVKKLVAGHGRASKEEVREAVLKKCDGVPEDASHDVIDAIAIAMCVEVPK